ncbi:uncharacterized protein [Antedon mediterranea]|uniref:uncharacterized protein n=1 Tax=Antedon mediterranea TaxID=105859 RepID=UPI003AF87582
MMDMVKLVQDKLGIQNEFKAQNHKLQKLYFENEILNKENNGNIDQLNELEAEKTRLEIQLINIKERQEHDRRWNRNRRRQLYNANLVLQNTLEKVERELNIMKESKNTAHSAKLILVNEKADLKERVRMLEAQNETFENLVLEIKDEKEELKIQHSSLIERFLIASEEISKLRNENINLMNKLEMISHSSEVV